MSDVIGRIPVPSVSPTATFPLTTDFPHGKARKRQVITHTFGAANAKIEQRYYYGDPATRYQFHRQWLNLAARKQLRDFFDEVQGPNVPFYYNAPNEAGPPTTRTVVFDNAPLTLEDLTNAACSVGLTFVEVQTSALTYSVNATVTRFPGSTLGTALQAQAQEIIPLVRIRVLDGAVPDIFLSDRRVTIGATPYLPRLLRMNEPGSEAILTQSIDGSTDDVTLTFGNADRVMVQVANDTQLWWARVELSLFHVDDPVALSGTILQLWAGYAIDWKSDAGPEFTLKASDILSALTLSSPIGSISRTCWRRYQLDGCPATGTCDTAHFPSADTHSCDQGYNTPNGCMAHQANQSYGATYCSPQTVILRSGGIGLTFPGFLPVVGGPLGTFLGRVSTWYPMCSVIADNIFGGTLPEIWHNDDGQAQYGLPVACKIAAGRGEDQFYIALGIVGRGPLGAFTFPQMWTSYGATQPDTFMGSTLDGQPNHGFQVGSNGVLKPGAIPTYGLRQALGTDPAGAHDYFSLGRVTGSGSRPAGWFTQAADGSQMEEVEDPAWDGHTADTTSSYNLVYSAGVALCEIRRTQASTEGLSYPGQHNLIALVSLGLKGYAWSSSGGGGAAGPFTLTEADPEDLEPGGNFQRINAFTSGDVSNVSPGDLATITGNSSSDMNVTGAVVVAAFQTGGSNLIELQVATPSTAVYGTGGTLTITPVSGGLRFEIPGCCNPFWVAINTYLRAIGMLGASASTQTGYFDVASAVAAAAIADATVPAIIGTGTETQFRFKGVIDDRKPTRDWIQSILNTALGYYTWSFGSLKVGCRSNASAVSAFTAGNMLFQSLQLTPVTPKFEKLTIQFSDQEYQFQSNAVDYVDQDLAARNNRIQNPLAQQFPVTACPTKSQAARIAIGRAREEMGGAVQVEQDAARFATWRSTILALDTDAGSVASITDPDVPGGVANFRVQTMRVNRDWSVDLIGKTVTASMYDETVGPKPADVQPAPVPTEPVHDSDLPGIPFFGAESDVWTPAGFLQLNGLSFADWMNLNTVYSGTFAVYYVDDSLPAAAHLTADIGTSDTSIAVDAWGDIVEGDLVEMDGEILLIGTITALTAAVTRGQKEGNIVRLVAHSSGAIIREVATDTINEAFPPGFFAGIGTASVNPLLVNWVLNIPLAGKRVLAVEGYVVNIYGASPTYTANFTHVTELGLIVTPYPGGSPAFTLSVDGTLCIIADAAPAMYLNDPFTATAVKAYVKQAPTGSDLVFTIYAGATAWLTLTIPNGSTSVEATDAQIAALASVPADTNFRLAITAGGSTFPGSDLSVFFYQ